MRHLWILLLALWPLAAQAQALREVRMADGRWYLAALPEGVAHPPLIVALHGGAGGPEQFARNSGLTARALRAGFAVAWPAGTGRRDRRMLLTWNALYCCGVARQRGVDDVAFLDRVAADARRRFGLGPAVYATGMSNGAMMAQTWAARRPGSLRAIATVSGTMDAARLDVRGRVPILHIHGLADESVPFTGGQGKRSFAGIAFAPVAAVMADFAAPFGPLARSDAVGRGVRRSLWRDRAGRVRMELVAIEGGGHVWPGGRGEGAASPVDADAEILRFFAAN